MKKLLFISLILIPSFVFAERKTTIWVPDTCDAEIVYTFDPQVDSDIVFDHFNKKCDAYLELDDQTAFDTILAENRVKNETVDFISKSFPEVTKTTVDENGNEFKTVKDFSFSYDANRNLIVDVPGLAKEKLDTVKQEILLNQEQAGVGSIDLAPIDTPVLEVQPNQ